MNELVIIPRSLEKEFLGASSKDLVTAFKEMGVCTTVENVDTFKYFVYNEERVDNCDLVEWAEDENVMLAEHLPQIIYLVLPDPNDRTVAEQNATIDAGINFIVGACVGALHKRARVKDYIPRIFTLGTEEFARCIFMNIVKAKTKKPAAMWPVVKPKIEEDDECDVMCEIDPDLDGDID